jgi:phosphoglycolate phosphatase
MPTYQTVLFDLDGTLTDPKPGITGAVNYALKRFGLEVQDLDKLIPFIGPPLGESFQQYYGFSAEQAQEAVRYYREYFAERGLYENAVYPGIPELLTGLQARGMQLAVATSKPTHFAQKILVHFQLDQYFALVMGSELDGTRSNKAEVIDAALAQLPGVAPQTTIMIGDRKHDIIGAQKNGLDSLAVGYGYGTAEELEMASPTYKVGSVTELAGFFAG